MYPTCAATVVEVGTLNVLAVEPPLAKVDVVVAMAELAPAGAVVAMEVVTAPLVMVRVGVDVILPLRPATVDVLVKLAAVTSWPLLVDVLVVEAEAVLAVVADAVMEVAAAPVVVMVIVDETVPPTVAVKLILLALAKETLMVEVTVVVVAMLPAATEDVASVVETIAADVEADATTVLGPAAAPVLLEEAADKALAKVSIVATDAKVEVLVRAVVLGIVLVVAAATKVDVVCVVGQLQAPQAFIS